MYRLGNGRRWREIHWGDQEWRRMWQSGQLPITVRRFRTCSSRIEWRQSTSHVWVLSLPRPEIWKHYYVFKSRISQHGVTSQVFRFNRTIVMDLSNIWGCYYGNLGNSLHSSSLLIKQIHHRTHMFDSLQSSIIRLLHNQQAQKQRTSGPCSSKISRHPALWSKTPWNTLSRIIWLNLHQLNILRDTWIRFRRPGDQRELRRERLEHDWTARRYEADFARAGYRTRTWNGHGWWDRSWVLG